MLSVDLLAEIDRLRAELGLSRSALLALAANCFVVQAAPVLKPTQREESLAAVDEIFSKLMEKARASA